MSLKHEQYRSLVATRKLLQDMITGEDFPKTRKGQREIASRCLKHFPPLLRTGEPFFSTDSIPCPEIEDDYAV
jgi:hypothetical protein